MKNTMKIKSLLSFFVPAAMMSLMVASCSDYDNGYDTNAIKFNEEFRKAYGDIDPEQDWNLAERGTVTVSTMKESEVKIYALRGNEYVLVGNYEGVKGTKMLGFDMVEGTTSIMVTDGVTAEKTVSGGVLTFGGTRAIFTDPDDSNGDGVYVTKIPAGGTIIKGVEYKQYKEINAQDYANMVGVIPEIGVRASDHTNLPRVTHDFSYVSNGEFVIYPYFWNTSSSNTIGVYYTDANGVDHEVDIYQNKGEGVEVTGATYEPANLDQAVIYYDKGVEGKISKKYDENGNVVAAYWQDWHALVTNQTWGVWLEDLGFPTDISSYSKLVVNANIKRGGNYRIGFYNGSDDPSNTNAHKVIKEVHLSDNNTDVIINLKDSEFSAAGVNLNNCRIYFFGSSSGGDAEDIFDVKNAVVDIQINKLELVKPSDNWTQYNGNNSNDIVTGDQSGRGQGIVVNIPEGTKFGMYLKKHDSVVGDCTFYSESSKNTNRTTHGWGVTDDGAGHVNFEDQSSNASFASTFYVGDQMFLGFEDWPNNTDVWGGSDFDLNDIVLAFDGSKPTIINEEAESWLMVCEDLGGSFDTDYNDVIFKVEHVSGKDKAKVTAMAAGGTLASYIVLNNPGSSPLVIGEIHQMLGAAPEKSGEYTPINANSRYEAVGSVVEIPVPSNFTMTYSTEVNSGFVNMGGFEIRTLNSGEGPAPVNATLNNLSNSQTSIIAAPDEGSAPYMLCLPYTYTKQEGNKLNTYVWAWPQELCTICSATYSNGKYSGSNGGAYLDFGAWVSSYSDNRDWYKNPNPAGALIVEPLLLKSEDIQQGGNNGGNENGNNNNVNYNNNGIYRVNGDEVCRFTFQSGGTTYALAYDENQSENGSLVIKELDNNDPDQIWRIETTTQGNSQYGYLYNYGADQRIDVNYSSSTTNWKAKWTESTSLSDRGGRFKFVVSGNGYYIYLRYWEKNDADGTPHYLGADNINDGACVWMNKTVSENKAILWNKTSASEPISTSGNGEWTTLTSLGEVSGQGSSSYTIAALLQVCGSASAIEIKADGDVWNSIQLFAMTNDNQVSWDNDGILGTKLTSSSTTITVSKATLQDWQNKGYTKVYMHNPSTSVQARSVSQ